MNSICMAGPRHLSPGLPRRPVFVAVGPMVPYVWWLICDIMCTCGSWWSSSLIAAQCSVHSRLCTACNITIVDQCPSACWCPRP